MTKKEQKDLDKVKAMYALRDEMAKGGKRSCPYCKSKNGGKQPRKEDNVRGVINFFNIIFLF